MRLHLHNQKRGIEFDDIVRGPAMIRETHENYDDWPALEKSWVNCTKLRGHTEFAGIS